jgi:Protein of unknown function (DUF4013)
MSRYIPQYNYKKGSRFCGATQIQDSGEPMDYAEILIDAYTYTKEGVIDNTNRWMRLILAVLCLGFPFNGYTMRIYRGKKPAPEVDTWGELFVDGLKLFLVGLVYIIPLMIIMLLIFGVMHLAMAGGNPKEPGILVEVLENLFMFLMYIVEIFVGIFLPVAYIRFTRTGIFSEAFNFSAMMETIGKIGWINYVVAVVLIGLVIGIPVCILIFAFIFIFLAAVLLFAKNLVVIIGLLAVMVIILLLVLPLVGVFHARYLTRVYESGNNPV